MRKVSDLAREQLVEIVEAIQSFLYLDCDDQGTEFWNPDKDWSGADVCEHVAELLSQHDLIPGSGQPDDPPNTGAENWGPVRNLVSASRNG